MRVLIADRDRSQGRVLADRMATAAIPADVVSNGEDAIRRARVGNYAAILLETSLPDLDGFAVCRTIRERRIKTPIMFLTARRSVEDRVRGLDSGGDDYLVKPVADRELLARLRAITRRGPIRHEVVLQVGDLRLDSVRRTAYRGDTPIELTPKEYAILEVLMREPGRVFSRFDLLERAWSYQYENRSNVIEVYIRYLREKVDRPFGRASLQTVRGVGYRACADLQLGRAAARRTPIR